MTAPAGPQLAGDVVVEVAVSRRGVFTSERMSLTEAQEVLTELRTEIRNIGDSPLLVAFAAAGYPELHLRANRITDVGIRSVSAGRSQQPGRGSSARHAGDGIRWTPRLLNRADVTGRVIG